MKQKRGAAEGAIIGARRDAMAEALLDAAAADFASLARLILRSQAQARCAGDTRAR